MRKKKLLVRLIASVILSCGNTGQEEEKERAEGVYSHGGPGCFW